jgi:hypothetical protein
MLSLVRNSAADRLISSFEYTLPDTASYIKERHFSTFHPLGSNIYAPTQGTRLLRFVISDGTAFLDPSTVRLAFTLNNTTPPGADAAATAALGLMKLAGPPLALFKRIRALVKGTVPPRVVVAGTPARVIREGVSWGRSNNGMTTAERTAIGLPALPET